MYDILSSKREKLKPINSALYNRRSNKFAQFNAESKVEANNKKNINEFANNNIKKYSFGYNFDYGYQHLEWYETDCYEAIPVSPKYDSLKKELLSNETSIINIEQFNNEYAKAQIHHKSYYCKQHMDLTNRHDWNHSPMKSSHHLAYIPIEYLLSIMIYCNYDTLQFNFSKTYRENNGSKHNEFYWLGRYIKRCVHIFGTYWSDSTQENPSMYYHGVSEQLGLPKYIGHATKIMIHGPLSTSSSFEVATNFANKNGIIIEFGTYELGSPYFRCSWLSDYGNEYESLFIQMGFEINSGLEIFNIYDCKVGYKYSVMIQALKNIQSLMCKSANKSIQNMTNSMYELMKIIIENQLSYKITKYESLKSLSLYGQNICNIFFQQFNKIYINCFECKTEYPFIIKLLFYQQYEWVDINLLRALFPNITLIRIENVNLCSSIMSDIGIKLIQNNIKQISITTNKKSDLSVKDAIDEYTASYQEMDIYITALLHSQSMMFYHETKINFIGRLLREIGQMYFKDINNKTVNLMEKLIKTELSISDASINEISNNIIGFDIDEHIFHKHCTDPPFGLFIDWREIMKNVHLGIFEQFYYQQRQWVKLNVINKLFPNITTIIVIHIRLCSLIFDDIFNHLSHLSNKKFQITFRLNEGQYNAYKHRAVEVTKEEQVRLCKKLTGYTSNDDIYEHDWGHFDKLYAILDNIHHRNDNKNAIDEEIFHLDLLIQSYAKLKYQKKFKSIGYDISVGPEALYIEAKKTNKIFTIC